jgi:hypothetical protein
MLNEIKTTAIRFLMSWRTMKLRHLASDDRKLEPSRIRCA